MKLKLLEPLRELFKDEVRKLGLGLGLPYNMLYRHPFPGPGLGVRILGEIKKEYVETLQKLMLYLQKSSINIIYTMMFLKLLGCFYLSNR